MKKVMKLVPIKNRMVVKLMNPFANGVAIPVIIKTAFEDIKLPYRPRWSESQPKANVPMIAPA